MDAADTENPSPLSKAPLEGHAEIVRLLLKANADATPEFWGFTTLGIAGESGHTQVTAILQEHGVTY